MVRYEEDGQIWIDENGYLDIDEMLSARAVINAENLEEALELNRYLMDIYNVIDVKSNNEIGCFLFLLFEKAHKTIRQ